MNAISAKTILAALGFVALTGFGVATKNFMVGAAGALALAWIIGLRVRRIIRFHFGSPIGHALRRVDLADTTSATLGHYYVHADGRNVASVAQGIYCQPPFDSNGIPLVDYGSATGKQHNVCTTAQYALENWEIFLRDHSPAVRETFLRQADWLLNELVDGCWRFHFAHPSRNLPKDWISAMAQGQGISVLLRAWQLTGSDKYLAGARRAIEVCTVPVTASGVACPTDDGVWLEEYPTLPDPPHVFNGHVWAMFGVWDLFRVTSDPAVRKIFDDGIRVLRANLARYDNGYWVWYDLQQPSFLVDSNYMHFQIDQLRVLHQLTGEPIFAEYVERWRRYQKSLRSRCCVVTHSLMQKLRRSRG